jgi:hypothetical protein
MNQREYEKLKADAAAEYRRKLEAIEVVWRMSGVGANSNGSHVDETPIGKGALQQAVKSAVQVISGDFTLRDVDKQIRLTDSGFAAKIKRPSLSSALKRLAADREIVLVSLGSGKRASIYRRPG